MEEEKKFLDNLEEKQANEQPFSDSEEEVWRVIEESDDITKEEFDFLEKNKDIVAIVAKKEYDNLLDEYDRGKINEKTLNNKLIDIIKKKIILKRAEAFDEKSEKQIIRELKRKIEDFIKLENDIIKKAETEKTEASEKRKRNAESRKGILEFLLARGDWTLDNFINAIQKNHEPHPKTGFVGISDNRFRELINITQNKDRAPVAEIPPAQVGLPETALSVETVAPESVPIPQVPSVRETEEEIILETEEEKEAAEEIKLMPPEKRKQFGRGVANIGYTAREWKAKAFAKVLNQSVKKTGKEQNLLHRFLKSYAEIYEKEAKTAEKNRKQVEMGKLKRIAGVSSLVGNTIRTGRILAELGTLSLYGLNPFRAYMTAALFVGRSAEAAKEARLKNEKVKAKTKIENPELAMKEALILYELAKRESGEENPSVEDLQKIFEESLVFKSYATLTRTVFNVEIINENIKTRKIPSLVFSISAGIIQRLLFSKFDKIDEDEKLTFEQKKIKKEKYLAFFGNYIKDMDRIVTGAGTVDMVSFGARKAEKIAKAVSIVLIFQSIEKLVELARHLDISETEGIFKKIFSCRGAGREESSFEKELPKTEERGGRGAPTEERGGRIPVTQERGEKAPEESDIVPETPPLPGASEEIIKSKELTPADILKEMEDELKEFEKESGGKHLYELSEAEAGVIKNNFESLNLETKKDFIKFFKAMPNEVKLEIIKENGGGEKGEKALFEHILKHVEEASKSDASDEVSVDARKEFNDLKKETLYDLFGKKQESKGIEEYLLPDRTDILGEAERQIKNLPSADKAQVKEILEKLDEKKIKEILQKSGDASKEQKKSVIANYVYDQFIKEKTFNKPQSRGIISEGVSEEKLLLPGKAAPEVAPKPEAVKTPEAAKAPEDQTVSQKFEATIQKGGNVWNTLTKTFGLKGNELGKAWESAKVFVDGKETSNKPSDMGLLDPNTKITYDKENNTIHITSAKGGRVGTDEELNRVFEKQRKAAPKWLREKLEIAEEKTEKAVSLKIEKEEPEIKRVPGQYPFGGKVVEEPSSPKALEISQDSKDTEVKPEPSRAPQALETEIIPEGQKIADTINKNLGISLTPEQIKTFTNEKIMEIIPFQNGEGVSIKVLDDTTVSIGKDGKALFTNDSLGVVSHSLTEGGKPFEENINSDNLNAVSLTEMARNVLNGYEAETKIFSALKKLSIAPARFYKGELGIDLPPKDLDVMLYRETTERVLSGKWTKGFLIEQAPKQVSEAVKNWFKNANIILTEEENRKTVAEVLSKYSTQIVEQIK